MLERQHHIVISEDCEDLLTPCSPQDEPYIPLTSVSPASSNNGLIVNKINYCPALNIPIVKIWEGKDEPLVEAAEVRFPKEMKLTHRVLEESKPRDVANNIFQWASQEAISEEGLRVLLHSPYPAAALMPHISMLVYPTPAHSLPYPSKELEFRRWKPPDHGGGERRPVYYTVNKKAPLSVTKHSPLNGIAPTLSTVLPTCQEWAEALRCLSAERVSRTRYKPPNKMGTVQCPSTEVISTKNNASIRRSLLYNAVLVLPIPLTSSGQIINTCRQNDKLVWQVHKPPNITGYQLLLEAVNKIRQERRWGYMPIPQATIAFSAHHLNNELVKRVHKLPRSRAKWLQTEAVNKINKKQRQGHLPIIRPFMPPTCSPLLWPTLTSMIHYYLCKVPIILRANGKSWL